MLSPKARRGQEVEDHFPEVEAFEPEEGFSKLQLILAYALEEDGPAAVHRVALIQGLTAAVEEEGAADALQVWQDVLGLVVKVAAGGESEAVVAVVQQLPRLCRHFQSLLGGQPEGEGLAEELMAMVEGIIMEGAQEEVSEACVEAAAGLLLVLPDPAARQGYVEGGLPAKLAGSDDEEMRILATHLLPRISQHLGGGACSTPVTPSSLLPSPQPPAKLFSPPCGTAVSRR